MLANSAMADALSSSVSSFCSAYRLFQQYFHNLMNELGKIDRIIKREIPEAPHEVFLVLDATTGQNAISQAKIFMETTKVTGVVLTKLDGTAKGGVVVAVKEELGLPVKWIGVGEGLMDFRPFEPEKFAEALFAEEQE